MSGATTIRAALDAAAQVLAAAGVAAPRREAQVLLGHALRVGREVVLGHPARTLSAVEGAALDALVGRRAAREPAAYILGEREFWSLPIRVTRDTLIPRPDSEAVVEATLAQVADRAARLTVLDLGTGSGCLLLALLSELPNATGVGVDVSPRALAVARANAGRLGLAGRARFVAGDWGRALSRRFDLIVANPPYIGAAEFAGLIPEITAYEPRIALLTGPNPLTSYRALAPEIARLLHPRGVAAVEVGADQAAAVAAIMGGHGLSEGGRRRDLAGIERCLVLRPARNIADIPKNEKSQISPRNLGFQQKNPWKPGRCWLSNILEGIASHNARGRRGPRMTNIKIRRRVPPDPHNSVELAHQSQAVRTGSEMMQS